MEEFPTLVNSADKSVITINNWSFSIGRSLSCDHIIQSLDVSRFHCVIKKNDNKWTLYDRSTNGTLVNSTCYKFNESVALNNGDVIKLGSHDFVFSHIGNGVEDVGEESVMNKAGAVFPNDDSFLEEAASALAAAFEEQPPVKEKESNPQSDDPIDPMEDELSCSVCSELFIKAVTLNCSHTFCKYCIELWKKSKSECPICRTPIKSVTPTLVLDNLVESKVNSLSEEVREARQEVIKQREAADNGLTSSSVEGSGIVIEVLSEDEDDFDDSDYDDESSYEDYVPFSRGYQNWYVGRGRCFTCNEEGHWARNCPRRRNLL